MTILSDRDTGADILAACRLGDRDAMRVLYESHKDKVYSITLYYFHGDTSAASDATQQVFLKVMTGIANFRADADFSTWLYRLVVNTCHDRTRKAYQREIAVDPADLATIAGRPSQEDDLARKEESAHVQLALSSLPPKLRMPLLLRYFDDLSYGQLAEALDCSVGTVASRMNRGHEILRQKLAALRGVGKSSNVKGANV